MVINTQSIIVILIVIIGLLITYWWNYRQKRLEFSKTPPIILDIRTYEEFATGHLPGAININTPLPPLSYECRQALRQKLCNELKVPKQHPILVYCKKGIRAAEALTVLYEMGYVNSISLGGIDTPPLANWKSAFV